MSREVRLYLVGWGVVGFAVLNGIQPVLFNLYLLRLGYGIEFVGLVNAVGLLAYALFAFPSGLISNRFGVRRTMTAGVALCALGFGLQPAAELMPGVGQDAWIVAFQLLGTVGLSLFFVNSQPFLTDATGPQERNHAYSMRMAIGTASGFLGSLVGGVLPDLFAPLVGRSLSHPAPYRYSLLVAMVLCIPGVLAMLPLWGADEDCDDEQAKVSGGSSAVPVWTFAAMALVSLLRMAGVGASRTFFNVYLDDSLGVSTAQIGLLFAIVQLVSAPVALTMPALSERWGNYRLIIAGTWVIVASTLPLALIPHWAAATLGRTGIYAVSSITDSAMGVYQMEIVPRRWRSVMAGVASTALGLSWTMLAFGGGYVISWLGYRTLFLISATMTTAGVLLFWAVFRANRGPGAASLSEEKLGSVT